MGAIKKGFLQSRDQYVKETQDSSASVAKQFANLSSAMKEEFHSRREREGRILDKLRDLETHTAQEFGRTTQICEQKFGHIHESFQEVRIEAEAGDRRFQARVIED